MIHAFRFDPDPGTVSDHRVLVNVPSDVGSPDGLTVDASGDLWVAIYGGGRVQRYAADGELLEELLVPAEQTTCCAFGGPGLNLLYVTTATENWTDEQRLAEPAGRARLPVQHGGDRPPCRPVPSRSGLVGDRDLVTTLSHDV